nr:RHS repeat-associated core domain-containing protein [Nitrospina sp. Nb-3]
MATQTDTLRINGRVFTSVFDRTQLKFTDTSPTGRTTTSFIDAQGRIVQQEIPNIFDTGFQYDARGRLTTVTQGTSPDDRQSTIAYNAAGFIGSITDPLGRAVQFEYDAVGRVTKQILPDLREINFTYDANGNVTSITPPGRPQHGFAYSAVNLETDYDPPNIGLPQHARQFAYNLDKQPTLITRPDGQTISFNYDAGGRLGSFVIPRGTISFGYDGVTGNLNTITAPGGEGLSFTYDGSLLLSTNWSGSISGFVSRAYDNNFRVTSRSVNGSHSISFAYDQDSLLTSAGSEMLTRDASNGLLTGTTLGNVTDSLSYNGFGEVSAYSVDANGTPAFSTDFTRDKLGRIIQKVETVQGVQHTYNYDYDPAGRLIEAKKDSVVTATYTYDSNSNRLNDGAVYDDQDRLVSTNTATYTYTDNGELLTKTEGGQTTTYNYDVLGNLISVQLPSGNLIEYVVDGRNRRIGKKVDRVLERAWLYKDSLNPIAELDGSGNVVSRFVYASRGNVPDYVIQGGVAYRIVSDHLGSPRLVIDTGTGAVVQTMDYDAWGNVLVDTNPGFQPFGFAGGLYDADTKLVRFGARDYDPQTGRWTSKDPIDFNGGDPNLFGYLQNDPINFVDPLGIFEFTEEELELLSLAAALPFIDGPLPIGDAGGLAIFGGVLAKKTIQEVSKVCLKQHGKKLIKGAYEFISQSGKRYTGSGKDVYRRLLEHLRSGKLKPKDIKSIKIHEVKGPKINRLKREQEIINKFGLKNLENKINAVRQK